MVSDRPYRPALGFEDTIDELKRMSGAQLDPTCVCAFMKLVQEDPELIEMRERDCA
jgi:HD-GYP domain-containing protein (c-di-GMP phosphodiesterase class II)